jgi:hydroxyacylglutathione hydrolase
MNIKPIAAFADNYIWMISTEGKAAVVDPGDAAPVIAELEARKLVLDTIIITHHHFDHTGGIETLKRETGCRVIGPDNPKIKGIDETMSEGKLVSVLGYRFSVLEVPGHTLDHIAYYCSDSEVLFCGDTLFVGGCGRVFEGTFSMMQSSLEKLGRLPAATEVYCTHEYTLANLNFALKVEPTNEDLKNHFEACTESRAENKPTVPSTIGRERAINPFLRWDSPIIIEQLRVTDRYEGNSAAAVFGAVRAWKDQG